MKLLKGVKYCSQCYNAYGEDLNEPDVGPAEADILAKGIYYNYEDKPVPYRANLCMEHFWNGTVGDMQSPEFKAFKPISERGWKLALEVMEERKWEVGEAQLELVRKRISLLKKEGCSPDRETEQKYAGKYYIKFNYCEAT